jgi:small nuclear ribonucleoprotein (snRNP)-like protein
MGKLIGKVELGKVNAGYEDHDRGDITTSGLLADYGIRGVTERTYEKTIQSKLDILKRHGVKTSGNQDLVARLEANDPELNAIIEELLKIEEETRYNRIRLAEETLRAEIEHENKIARQKQEFELEKQMYE